MAAGKLFAAGLETYQGLDAATRNAIDRGNALTVFPRLGGTPEAVPQARLDQLRHGASRGPMRIIARLISIS